MGDDPPSIAPSMLYAWAALMEGVPFANGAPNLTDIRQQPASCWQQRQQQHVGGGSRGRR